MPETLSCIGAKGPESGESHELTSTALATTWADQVLVLVIHTVANPTPLKPTPAVHLLRRQGRFRFNWHPKSQRIYYGTAVDGDGHVIDEVLVLAMLKPRSYTREDVLELHTHGGGVCAQRVLRACIEAGARPARPGEFTLRAFLNGRLDLSQVNAGSQLGEQNSETAFVLSTS